MHDYIKERTIKNRTLHRRNQAHGPDHSQGIWRFKKSTVHKDLTERLPEINPDLADQVKHILEYHKSIRHLRGEKPQKN
ncbi:sporulation transcriptional regulator SpoIIID [Paenibacillus rhizoplanae]